ncbi:hypothetical protein CT157_22620 [Pseudomonas syringae]|jgi:hypothetical protein|uniref:Uncharacterized protein n=1 Tax=Pseudomonas syringae TaxID=317 RepID=A0A3T0JZ17_PSESX|nr:hypothetical protein CT157_22620 [Pseudomonas syringae]
MNNNLADKGDFSNEVLDPTTQAERDQFRTQWLQDVLNSDPNKVYVDDEVAIPEAGRAVTKTLVGNKGNFRGHLTYTIEKIGGQVKFNTVQYKIERFNNQGGGNKANMNTALATFLNPQFVTFASPDALWQDGEWHSWSVQHFVPITGGSTVFNIRTIMIFDIGGNDPKADVEQSTMLNDF